VLGAVDGWLLEPAPARRLAVLRILTGAYAVVHVAGRWPSLWSMADLPARQFEAVGVLAWLDAPPPSAVARALVLATPLVAGAFALGWHWRVTGPLLAVLFVTVASYRLSWGHVLHTDHLPSLHVVIIGLSPAAAAWSLDARRAGEPEPEPDARFGVPVTLLMLATVVTYVLAGIAKARIGGLGWVTGDALRNQVAYDNLRKAVMGDVHSPVGAWAVRHGWLFPPMAALTVALELGAPLALRRGRLRSAWAVGAWSFHVGIWALMAIAFQFQLLGVAYACFFRAERVGEWVARRPAIVRAAAR
jgi:hypothetical protein